MNCIRVFGFPFEIAALLPPFSVSSVKLFLLGFSHSNDLLWHLFIIVIL